MAKMGRRDKGLREAMITRVTPELRRAVEDRAATRGVTLSDFIAAVLAHKVGRPEDAPVDLGEEGRLPLR